MGIRLPAALLCPWQPTVVGCPECGDLDPLPFGLIPAAHHVPCQSCGANLLDDPTHKGRGLSSRGVLEFERGYRAALVGAAPDLTLLQGASSAQFRQFVDDTLRLVANLLDERPLARYGKLQPSPGPSRQELIRTILHCDMYERRARYRNSLKVWKSLLLPLTPEARRNLARVSRAWPSSLQRSLASPSRKLPGETRCMGGRSHTLCPRFEYKHALNSAILVQYPGLTVHFPRFECRVTAGLHAPLSTLRRTPHGMLRMTRGRLVRYTFTVMDLHHLLLAGLPTHYINFPFLRCPQRRRTQKNKRMTHQSPHDGKQRYFAASDTNVGFTPTSNGWVLLLPG
jgi:hypothetical protein